MILRADNWPPLSTTAETWLQSQASKRSSARLKAIQEIALHRLSYGRSTAEFILPCSTMTTSNHKQLLCPSSESIHLSQADPRSQSRMSQPAKLFLQHAEQFQLA